MVRKFFQFAGLALVFAATATVAHAQSASGGSGGSGGSSGAAPEIDPGSIASAVTLLCGGVLMMTDKFRGK